MSRSSKIIHNIISNESPITSINHFLKTFHQALTPKTAAQFLNMSHYWTEMGINDANAAKRLSSLAQQTVDRFQENSSSADSAILSDRVLREVQAAVDSIAYDMQASIDPGSTLEVTTEQQQTMRFAATYATHYPEIFDQLIELCKTHSASHLLPSLINHFVDYSEHPKIEELLYTCLTQPLPRSTEITILFFLTNCESIRISPRLADLLKQNYLQPGQREISSLTAHALLTHFEQIEGVLDLFVEKIAQHSAPADRRAIFTHLVESMRKSKNLGGRQLPEEAITHCLLHADSHNEPIGNVRNRAVQGLLLLDKEIGRYMTHENCARLLESESDLNIQKDLLEIIGNISNSRPTYRFLSGLALDPIRSTVLREKALEVLNDRYSAKEVIQTLLALLPDQLAEPASNIGKLTAPQGRFLFFYLNALI